MYFVLFAATCCAEHTRSQNCGESTAVDGASMNPGTGTFTQPELSAISGIVTATIGGLFLDHCAA
jgi:hypothetical protein